MTDTHPICPHCASVRTAWKAKSRVWECLDCEDRFDAPPPAEIDDPVGRVEDAFAKRARALADAPTWVEAIATTWPAPIAHNYALLRTLLRQNQIDASALVLKDLAELLARFSALTLACDLLQNGSSEQQTQVLNSLFAKSLAMGDWVRLADTWAQSIQAAPQPNTEWITRPIARLWRDGNKRTALCTLMSDTLVHWRNQTIGHGVRGSDLGPTMDDLERFLGKDKDSLLLALQAAADLGSLLELVDASGRVLKGAQVMHEPASLGSGHVLGPQQPLKLRLVSDRQSLALRSFMAARRCEVCGQVETFHFDSAKPRKLLPDFRVLNYERGHALHVPGSADPELLQDWSRISAPIEADVMVDFDADAALPADVLAMLDEQSIEKGYLSPAYLRDPLRAYIEEQRSKGHGGLYWLRAPAHVGKSTFVQGLDPQIMTRLKESPLIDALAVAVFTIRREYRYHLAQLADTLREGLKQVLNLSSGSQKLPELDTQSPTPEAFIAFLSAFQEYGRRPMLVIIDGLDELVEEYPGILDLFTSHALPPEVFVLLTSRPLSDCPPWMRPRLKPLLEAAGRQVDLRDAEYADLLNQYAINTLQGKKSSLDWSQIYPKLLERSDGRFLYFRFLVDRLAEGDLKAENLDALTSPERLLPSFVQALRKRYATTPMGERIDRTLGALALAEDAFNRQMRQLPASVQTPWQGLPMPVLCDLIEGTPAMTPNLVSMLFLIKPLLGTWRGEGDTPRYRLGIKGLEDLLRQDDSQALTDLARRWVDNLLLRQKQWLQAAENQRGSAKDNRGAALDWVLCHFDGLISLLADAQQRMLREKPLLLENLWQEMMQRADDEREHSHNRIAVQNYAIAETLLRLAMGRDLPDSEMAADVGQKDAIVNWLYLLNGRSVALGNIGDLSAAIEESTRAIGVLNDSRSHLGTRFPRALAEYLAQFYTNRGANLQVLGDGDAASVDYDHALAIWNLLLASGAACSPDMGIAVASLVSKRGAMYLAQGNMKAAIDHFDSALAILKDRRDRHGAENPEAVANSLAMAYMNRGVALLDLGNSAAGLENYKNALAIWKELLNHPGAEFRPELVRDWSRLCMRCGDALFDLGELTDAINSYGQAIADLKFLRDDLGADLPPEAIDVLATACMNRGLAWSELGDPAAALDDYEEALTAGKYLRDRLLAQHPPNMAIRLAKTYWNRGRILSNLGASAAAIDDYDNALTTLKKLVGLLGAQVPPDMARELAVVYWDRGKALAKMGQSADAVNDFDQSLAIWQDLRDYFGSKFPPSMIDSQASAYRDRGNALVDQGSTVDAIKAYGQAIATWRDLLVQLGTEIQPDYAERLAIVYMRRGGAFSDQGDPGAAIEDYGQAIAIWKDARDHLGAECSQDLAHRLAMGYMTRGLVLLHLHYLAAALEDRSRALAVWNEIESNMGENFPPDWRKNRDDVLREMDDLLTQVD